MEAAAVFGTTTPPPQTPRGDRHQEGRESDVDQNPEIVSIDTIAKVTRLMADKFGNNKVPTHRLQRLPQCDGQAPTHRTMATLGLNIVCSRGQRHTVLSGEKRPDGGVSWRKKKMTLEHSTDSPELLRMRLWECWTTGSWCGRCTTWTKPMDARYCMDLRINSSKQITK